MITRIVKLTFQEDKVDTFVKFFEKNERKILDQEGCISLQLKKDADHANILFTLSQWDSEDDLSNYKDSDYFKMIWPQVKEWFKEPAETHTLKSLYE